jgi:hypothetical protein
MRSRPLANLKVRGSIPTSILMLYIRFSRLYLFLVHTRLMQTCFNIPACDPHSTVRGSPPVRCSLPAKPTRKLGQIRLLASKSFWVKMGKMFFFTKMLLEICLSNFQYHLSRMA